ncbi:hypothetical protein KO525_01310 [Psychrosphaera sp. B3R10]|uniref:hypothetical protein n=1 Tax=unclassified Psychrosphaera TaxID=2641570 RepID=UPI001C0919C6|nr:MULTISPECIES: hypothetical protein [unclassified Psychrosphaera]MBU2883461.1 hypothetical protein [Psychrosphaera sp. I2R16]MBU2988022.1 hypothetical protein [Psychrosphaera sp. B3R10]MDO6721549.1 hypothetical protein [Psychrosphaera sp. 1_MG-2023]
MKKMLILLLLCCAPINKSLADTKVNANDLLEKGVEERFSLTFIEKLLLIEPEVLDRFSLLEHDIKRFNSELAAVTKTYSDSLVKFDQYKTKQINQHNVNEEFVLFNQLENQQHMQGILSAEYHVNRVREKLYESLFEYESIKKRIETVYQEQHKANIVLVKEKLLAGDSFVIAEGQKQQILEFVLSYQDSPVELARMLLHRNVQQILPDYLIEQLNIFSQSEISLADALKTPEVMAAVISKIEDIDVLPKMGLKDIGYKIYSVDQAPKVLKLGAPPLLIDTYLNASIQRNLNLALIYELPVPAEEIIRF